MDLRSAQKNVLAFAYQIEPRLNDFQVKLLSAMSPALERVCGRDVAVTHQRFWEERSRGHSKSNDLAIVILWVLIFSRLRITGVGVAGSKDQARLLRDAVEGLLRRFPVLSQVIEVQAYRIVNKHTASVFEIMSSEVGTSYGIRPSMIIADEVCHWQESAIDLWHSLLSSAAKTPTCVMACITNAGWQNTEWWKVRELVRNDPAWQFNRLPGCVANWLNEAQIEEQRRLLPPAVFDRLWLNQWSDSSGDCLNGSDITSAITMNDPPDGREEEWRYVAGIDLGLRRDHTAIVVVGKHVGRMQRLVEKPKPLPSVYGALCDAGYFDAPADRITYKKTEATGRAKLAAVRIFAPENGRVELADVERALVELHQQFGLSKVSADWWQAEYLLQRLAARNINVEGVNFGPTVHTEMASTVLDSFREKTFDMYDEPRLTADLRGMKFVERSYGVRIEAGKAAEGTRHADSVTALGLAMLAAKSIRGNSSLPSIRQLVLNG